MPARRCITCGTRYVPGDPSRCGICAPPVLRARARAHTARRESAPGDGARRRLRQVINKAGSAICAQCGRQEPAPLIEVDHLVRLADGGHDIDGNVRPMCGPCHRAKTWEEGR